MLWADLLLLHFLVTWVFKFVFTYVCFPLLPFKIKFICKFRSLSVLTELGRGFSSMGRTFPAAMDTGCVYTSGSYFAMHFELIVIWCAC